jgi:type IV pilus assembly protein PilY1
MKTDMPSIQRLLMSKLGLVVSAGLLLGGMGLAFLANSQSTPPSIPAINLAADPLYAPPASDKPVIALSLSVEFPTVGSQYPSGSGTDSNYSNTTEYLGYYDAESCYTYNNSPTETPTGTQTASDYKRFDRSGAAVSRMCNDAFSGNFLNWASSSAIDMLRLALSGGDRYIDTDSLTILQRAVIPNGDPTCMWNNSNFPAKQLQKDGGGTGKYWGAVPNLLITQAGANDIWVANTLNRIYFGTSRTGSCSDTGAYTLGVTVAAASFGPVVTYTDTALPTTGMTECANENGTCSFSGSKEVWYGANRRWAVAPVTSTTGVACTNAQFGDPIVGTAKKCFYRDGTPPVGTAGLNSDGFFYARVNVCTSTAGTLTDVRDYGLCKQYPNTKYKPTGVIQKYSDALRLAAFGYALEQTASYDSGRYGGVLRAPMKYVGNRTFNETGQENTPSTGNPNIEWDQDTGVFRANPDGDTTYNISGVINYLNKFGRTGSVPGRYKRYDPVGELHYETLRYLQGLQPTEAATRGLTTEMYDGFPIYTTWTDPYGGSRTSSTDYSCTKANIVVIGDVNTHDGNRLPSPDDANNIVDINKWRTVVQKFEKNEAVDYPDGQGTTRSTGNPNGYNNSVPSATRTSQIMGSAYWARTHDIRGTSWTNEPAKQRPGLRVRTFTFDVNENGSNGGTAAETTAQTNYRRFSNQFFMAAKYGGFETDPSNPEGNPYNTWGNPFKQENGTANNNVWQDTVRPAGEANSYYLQSSARGILTAFDEIFSRASTQARSIAGAALQNKNLTTTGTAFYQGAFDTSNWTGDVISTPLTLNADNELVIGTTAAWSAATRLTARANPESSRNIVVGRTSTNPDPVATDFKWAEIDADLKTNLGKLTPSATADTLGADRLSYLRGSNTRDGTTFRQRSGKLLGDIVNSGVVYSGAPSTSVPSDPSYSLFVTANASRTAAVFVGANDGMLHAFNASNGDELFGYIPSWMGPKLAALSAVTYAANHQSYVDATPVVGEVKVATSGAASDWKTVLVGGTGGGGRGVYALDVTDPSTFSASKVMWEFTQKHDADMGFVIGAPKLVKMRTSAPSATTPTFRWFAAVASGVNNYVNDGQGNFSSTGSPTIFLLALDKPAGTAWTATGSTPNYYKISLPFDTLTSATLPTGVVNFQTIIGASREVTQLYAGDLHGNLWKLDFSLLGSTDWNINKLSYFKTVSGSTTTPYPLYIAKSASGTRQPITMAPALSAGTVSSNVTNIVVSFGTGKFMESGDKNSTTQQSFYSIFDNNSPSADTSGPVVPPAISGRGRLAQGVINTTAGTVTVPEFKWGRPTRDSDTTTRAGYYFDFPSSGEKAISNPKIVGNTLTFNTLIPAAPGSTGGCTAAGGSGRTYDLNLDSGNGVFRTSTVGLLGESLIVQIPGATTYTKSRTTGRRTKTEYSDRVDTGSGSATKGSRIGVTTVSGRLSWRQINNYQDLKNN